MSESEGLDRSHMKLPKVQTELLYAISEVNPNVIGILSGGSAIEMEWDGALRAILHGYLTGQAGGGAVSSDMVDGMVTVVNGHFFRGAGKIIGGFFGNSRKNKAYKKKLM